MLSKIISGGQTGVDRAALDVAISFGIDHGGFVPKGRKAEDGVIATGYNLTELDTRRYAARTEKNVAHSDGTLIISRGGLKGGSRLTRTLALSHEKPWLNLDLGAIELLAGAGSASSWIDKKQYRDIECGGSKIERGSRHIRRSCQGAQDLLCLNLVGISICDSLGRSDASLFPPTGMDRAVDTIESRLSLRKRPSFQD